MCSFYQRFVRIADRWYWIIALLILLSFLCSHIGMWIDPPPSKTTHTTAWYQSIKVLLVSSPVTDDDMNIWLDVARWLGVVVLLSGVVGVLSKLFHQTFLTIYVKLFAQSHIIVAGLGASKENRIRLIRLLRKQGKDVVVIEPNPLHPEIESCRQLGVIVLCFSLEEKATLRKAQLKKARSILFLSPQDRENINLLHLTHRFLKDNSPSPALPSQQQPSQQQQQNKSPFHRSVDGTTDGILRVSDPGMVSVVRSHEFYTQKNRSLLLRVFCPREMVARAMLREAILLDQPTPLQKILILGTGNNHQLGEILVTRAAKDHGIDQFDENVLSAKQLEIHIKDDFSEDFVNCLVQKFPFLYKMDDKKYNESGCFLHPIVESASFCGFRSKKVLQSIIDENYDAIFICVHDESIAIKQAIELRHAIDSQATEMQTTEIQTRETGKTIPIIIRVPEREQGMSVLLNGTIKNKRSAELIPVGMDDRMNEVLTALNPELEMLAQVLHQQYIQLLDFRIREETNADNANALRQKDSRKRWTDLEPVYKTSSRNLAARITFYVEKQLSKITNGTSFRLVYSPDEMIDPTEGFVPTDSEIEQLAEEEHHNWTISLLKEGWKYDPTLTKSDPILKQSPSLTDWENLTEADKKIDRNIIRRLSITLAKADYRLVQQERITEQEETAKKTVPQTFVSNSESTIPPHPNKEILDEVNQKNQWVLANKVKPLWAYLITEETVTVSTLEGDVTAHAGDYICQGEQDDQWTQSKETLFQKYFPTEELNAQGWKKFLPKPDIAAVLATQVDHPFRVVTTWGTLQGNPGDYLLKHETDKETEYPTDVWIVQNSIFATTYQTPDLG